MNESVRLNLPIEFINIAPVNPLISRCEIKVCWVGETPNRNKSIITKEVAKEMANSLPGSPIVGFYNEEKQDFEAHNCELCLKDGKVEFKDTTRPYGFVDLGAKVWFAKYLDGDGVEREYLVTEGYLWTKQYPECQRILDRGNNQSMELDKDLLNATWTKDDNSKPQFFIINEAIVSKLCILGDDCEPCFQGSNITAPTVQFSFDNGFKEQLFFMMNELKDLLNKGGTKVFTKYSVNVGDSLWTALYSCVKPTYSIENVCEEEGQKFAVLKAEDKFYRLDFSFENDNFEADIANVTELESFESDEEPQFSSEDIAAFESSLNPPEEENSKDKTEQEIPEENNNPVKVSSYVLEEIPEYVELNSNFAALQTNYDVLVAEKAQLEEQIASLTAFKNKVEKKEKEAMIKSFYMLNDEDKKDVIENIDTYSLDEIEAKLSIICVRNKVSFNLEEDYSNHAHNPTTYDLNDINMEDDPTTPAWVKKALEVAKTMN